MFSISEFYLNPKYYFSFSNKLKADLANFIENQILKKSKHLTKVNWEYWVIITSEKRFKYPRLSETEIGKRNRQKSLLLTLPYDTIINTNKPNIKFCEIVFDNLKEIVSQDYEIDNSILAQAKDAFLKKVESNSKKYKVIL